VHELPAALRGLASAAAVAVLGLLLVALTLGISPNVDAQLVALGERVWPGYASEIRKDPGVPECDLEAIKAQAKACAALGDVAPAPGEPADPFEEVPAGGPPAEPPAAPPAEADPFAEPAAVPQAAAAPSPEAAEADPFAEEAAVPPPAGDSENPFDQPPGGAEPDAASCPSLVAFAETCEARWTAYETQIAKRTPTNMRYRSVELAIGDFARFPYWRHTLLLLLILGGITTTVRRAHIALRDPTTLTEHRLQQVAQFASFLMLAVSNLADHGVQAASGAATDDLALPVMWGVGFLFLAALNLWHLASPPALQGGSTTPTRALMVIPLFAYMAIGSGLHFLVVEQHPSGQAIFLHKFLQHPSIYVGIGLYIWAGMLFSITRVATLTFGLMRPWHLPADVMAWLVIVLAALPTAYSGASGIFVLAAGAVIFRELTRVGATPRQALSATAMSGSLGVVLAPCLVVVLISMLNSEVTSAQLFGAGLYVFALTAVLTLVALFLRGGNEPVAHRGGLFLAVATGVGGLFWLLLFPSGEALAPHVAWFFGEAGLSPSAALALRGAGLIAVVAGLAIYQATVGSVATALAGMRTPVVVLVPFALLAVVVLAVYRFLFGTDVSEHTAMLVLPAMLLAIVIYDRAWAPPTLDGTELPRPEERLWSLLVEVTGESSTHIGALLMLMAASVALGGVVERTEVMNALPESLGGLYPTMTVLVVAMVLVGMTMDALGAVVLVSASIAGIAYKAGIHPVHFWMMVLVAFELGYLSPPVALNHLLARQAIGPDAHVENHPVDGFWLRNEHVLLPLAVMGSALLIVAYVPLVLWY
jgi:TRAP-type C4-dicarboxylate transport system permease large subunit